MVGQLLHSVISKRIELENCGWKISKEREEIFNLVMYFFNLHQVTPEVALIVSTKNFPFIKIDFWWFVQIRLTEDYQNDELSMTCNVLCKFGA